MCSMEGSSKTRLTLFSVSHLARFDCLPGCCGNDSELVSKRAFESSEDLEQHSLILIVHRPFRVLCMLMHLQPRNATLSQYSSRIFLFRHVLKTVFAISNTLEALFDPWNQAIAQRNVKLRTFRIRQHKSAFIMAWFSILPESFSFIETWLVRIFVSASE